MYADPNSSNNSDTAATVLVIGMGALGCPAATALAEAGGVRLILADDDVVETTNLQRQRLFERPDLGCRKVEVAARRLQNRYPNVSVETRQERLTADNAFQWFQQADFVIDACDDPATKFLINAVAISTHTPFVYGGVLRTGGSTMTVLPGKSACLACVFPRASQASQEPGCDRAGILASVAGVVGTHLALAALACLSADSRTEGGVLTAYELRGRRWRALRFDRVSDCRVCGEPRTSASTPRRVQPCLS